MDIDLRSGVSRVIDPRFPSNLFILIAAPSVGLAWMIWKLASEGDWSAAAARAVVAGAASFLSWAIARELDPDRPWTAGVAAALAGAVLGSGVPSLLVSGAVLMAARVAARTTGRSPSIIDLAAMAGFAALVGASDPGFAAALVLGIVLMADRSLPGGASSASPALGAVGVALTVAAAVIWGTFSPAPGLPHGPEWLIVAVAAIGLAALGRPRRIAAIGDLSREALSVGRVRSARFVAVIAAGLTALWLGGPGLTAGSAVWAALAASALPGGSRASPPSND